MGKALGLSIKPRYVSSIRTSRNVFENPKHRDTVYVQSLEWIAVLTTKKRQA